MDVSLAVIADAANVSQEGKLNILGCFDSLYAPNFPTRHPSMVLVLRFHATPAEYGTSKSLEFKLLGEDGEEIATVQADVTVDAPPDPALPHKIEAIINVNDMIFPKAGHYAIHVLVGGEDKTQIPLRLGMLPSQPHQEETNADSAGG